MKKYISIFMNIVCLSMVYFVGSSWGMQSELALLNSDLVEAVKLESVDRVRQLLGKGADVNIIFNYKKTPILFAVEKGNLPLVRVILPYKPDLEKGDFFNKTALILAAMKGNEVIVNELLAAGAQVNAASIDDITPLLAAVQGGFTGIAQKLLLAGADPNVATRDKLTPLMAAAAGGHAAIVDALIKSHADLNAQDNWGNTPLVLAIVSGHLAAANRLIGAKADVTLGGKAGYPLDLAVTQANFGLVRALLHAGASLIIPGMREDALLVKAIDWPDFIKLLRLYGAVVDPAQKSSLYATPALAQAMNGQKIKSALALLDPIIQPDVQRVVLTILMGCKCAESPLSTLPKDVIKLIISTAFPEYVVKSRMDPKMLEKYEVRVLVDRLPIALLAQAVQAGAVNRQAILDAWKNKLQEIRKVMANAGTIYADFDAFSGAFLAQIDAMLLQEEKVDTSKAALAAAVS